jgi:hypothetical protein
MARDRDEEREIEKTREIGTGLKGETRTYTGGNRVENKYPDEHTEEGRKRREDESKDDRAPKEGTWEKAKQYLDPDSK